MKALLGRRAHRRLGQAQPAPPGMAADSAVNSTAVAFTVDLLGAAAAVEEVGGTRFRCVPLASRSAPIVVTSPSSLAGIADARPAGARAVVVWDRRESPPPDDVARCLESAEAYVTGARAVVLVAHLDAVVRWLERDAARPHPA